MANAKPGRKPSSQSPGESKKGRLTEGFGKKRAGQVTNPNTPASPQASSGPSTPARPKKTDRKRK